MKRKTITKLASGLLAAATVVASFQAAPEDVDIFSVDENSTVNAPNVLIVLDNSTNWSRASQQWEVDGVAQNQGKSEVFAIQKAIEGLSANVNVGLMEYITGGSSSDTDHAKIRYHIRPMNAANKLVLNNNLNTIYNNITDPTEKRSLGNPFGNLFWDVYNYLAGAAHSNGGLGTRPTKADSGAYTTTYSNFRSPLTSTDTCTRTIVIFIGNNTSSGPSVDSQANVDALHALAGGGADGDTAIAQIPFADYVTTLTPTTNALGYTPACFASKAACDTAVNNANCTNELGYQSCFCDAGDTVACPNNHFQVVGKTLTTSTTVHSGPSSTSTPNTPTGDIIQTCKSAGQASGLNPVCPSPSDVLQTNTPAPGSGSCPASAASCDTRTQTSWNSCAYVDIGNAGCSPASKHNYELRGTKNETVTVTETSTNQSQTSLGETNSCYSSQADCNPTDGAWSCAGFNGGCECTTAGSTAGCPPGGTSKYQVRGQYTRISSEPTGTYSTAPAGPYMLDEWARFLRNTGVLVPGTTDVRAQVTTYTIDVFNAQQHPEFSALLFNAARVGGGKYFRAKDQNSIISALRQIFTEVQAVNSAFSSASLPINATNRTQNENQVFIGVFKPNRNAAPQWFGNLKRFQIIRDNADIALGDEAGNNAINNQTGFLADCSDSWWTVDSGNYWQLQESDDPPAVGMCTESGVNKHSDEPDGPFVEKGAVAEVLRRGNDPSATVQPDGKYAVDRNVYTLNGSNALALFNDKTGSPAHDYEHVDFLDPDEDDIADFIKGQDLADDDKDGILTGTRSTIHGDVVHSRPQPINYGDTTRGVVVFYGSNDGHYRAVSAADGTELWSFIAPEHHARLPRLRFSGISSKNVRYFRVPANPASPAQVLAQADYEKETEPKGYFFDGPTGTYQEFNASNEISLAMIFPTMRRGGRMVYAFDVSNPASPAFKWKAGCNGPTAGATCGIWTEGNAAPAAVPEMAKIGQTWSNASVARIRGYSDPVVIMGGGYDTCGDENSRTPCTGGRGQGVYVFDAQTGSLVEHFDFTKKEDGSAAAFAAHGVAADVALVSKRADNIVDHAYAADMGGNVYRIDFFEIPPAVDGDPPTRGTRHSRVAYTNGSYRKFLFGPALFQADASTVYVALGSGDREHPLRTQYPSGTSTRDTNNIITTDTATAVLNRFYMYVDNLADTDEDTATNMDTECQLTDPGDADYCGTNGGMLNSDSASCGTPAVNATAAKGWFKSLDSYGIGEQVVSSAVIAGGYINFSTNRPTPPSDTACATSLGEARGYFVNLLNGSGAIGVNGNCGGDDSSTFVGGGLPPSPVIATVKVGNTVETIVIGAVPKDGGAGSAISPTLRNPNPDQRRRPVYWYKSSGDN